MNENIIKWVFGSGFGIVGAFLIALNLQEYSKFAFVAFAISALTWSYLSYKHKDYALLSLQGAFLVADIIGIIRWF